MDAKKTKTLTKSALFAALVYVFTMSGAFVQIGGGAYLHIGDALIYCAAIMLPLPFSVIAAAVGGMLADITLGSAIYAVPTLIIKALTALCAKKLYSLSKNGLIADLLVCLSGVVTVLGYFVAEIIIYALSSADGIMSAVVTAAAGMPYNLLQALASAVVFVIISPYIKKIK